MTDKTHVIEIAEAELNPGVNAQQMTDGITASTRFLESCDGFVRSQSVRSDNRVAGIVECRD